MNVAWVLTGARVAAILGSYLVLVFFVLVPPLLAAPAGAVLACFLDLTRGLLRARRRRRANR